MTNMPWNDPEEPGIGCPQTQRRSLAQKNCGQVRGQVFARVLRPLLFSQEFLLFSLFLADLSHFRPTTTHAQHTRHAKQIFSSWRPYPFSHPGFDPGYRYR